MRLPFPREALMQHLIVLGKTGSGKSSKVRLIVEDLLGRELPVCILDPKGDWWGIKSSADGQRPGYPVVIFGGEHADIPLNPQAGAVIAEFIATGNRPSIIDMGEWTVGERTRFFIDFSAAFFKHARGARYLVIDEVHNFAPQGKVLDVDSGRMLHWANKLASEGRGRGITLLVASQRPQKVHKDFVTSCETLIACKVIHKLDRDAIKDWIDGCADGDKGREVIASLAQLKKPEGWVWSPEIEFGPERLTFKMFSTYDSFKPRGEQLEKLPTWNDPELELDAIREQLSTLIVEAQSNDPKALRKRIQELEGQVAQGGAYSQRDIDRAFLDGRVKGREEGFLAGKQAGETETLDSLEAYISGKRGPTTYQHVEMGVEMRENQNGTFSAKHYTRPSGPPISPQEQTSSAPKPKSNLLAFGSIGSFTSLGGERRLMCVLYNSAAPIQRKLWATLAGLSDSGTLATYISRKISEQSIRNVGGLYSIMPGENIPRSNKISLDDLFELWKRLGPKCIQMAKALHAMSPNSASRAELGAIAGLADSGTLATYISRTVSSGLISRVPGGYQFNQEILRWLISQ